jgi:hypothetical protein
MGGSRGRRRDADLYEGDPEAPREAERDPGFTRTAVEKIRHDTDRNFSCRPRNEGYGIVDAVIVKKKQQAGGHRMENWVSH